MFDPVDRDRVGRVAGLDPVGLDPFVGAGPDHVTDLRTRVETYTPALRPDLPTR
ncbi:hypothetical protein [Nocardia aurantia]|uniref:Uncharacterized protein n=1 Tax=Nocardia aurantia TaxID=2585199 RepID=A0A7K0DXS7_9NOCA|nr:hypothetical protein [Nocardia aurantia]MQY30358.1 hypothetical protein [Nocardia aurantia]